MPVTTQHSLLNTSTCPTIYGKRCARKVNENKMSYLTTTPLKIIIIKKFNAWKDYITAKDIKYK